MGGEPGFIDAARERLPRVPGTRLPEFAQPADQRENRPRGPPCPVAADYSGVKDVRKAAQTHVEHLICAEPSLYRGASPCRACPERVGLFIGRGPSHDRSWSSTVTRSSGIAVRHH